MRSLEKFIPLNRLGHEAEVSAAIVFLLSPAAAFISGSCIRVDGATPNMQHNFVPPDGPGNQHFEGFHREVTPKVFADKDDD